MDSGNSTTPLSVQDPSILWRWYKCHYQGTRGKTLTRKDVPVTDLTGKWIIISGANNGIGREAALFFAQCGANIILSCRNPPPNEIHPEAVVEECRTAAKTAGHDEAIFEWWEIDMLRLSTVDAFAKRWLDTGRPLDILCNNAGMGGNPGSLSGTISKTKDGFEYVHQVNFLSHVLLTELLLPSLAKAKAPRIACTTSCMSYIGRYDNIPNFSGQGCKGAQFYANNKLYFQVWLTEFQKRLLETKECRHLTINGLHPGYVNSGIWFLTGPKGIQGTLIKMASWVMQSAAYYMGITNEQGAYAIEYVATSVECGPDPKVQGVGEIGGKGGGRFFMRIWEAENLPYCYDEEARVRLWGMVNEELKSIGRPSVDEALKE